MLDKLKTVDGTGSGLTLTCSADFRRRTSSAASRARPAGRYLQAVDAAGGVSCGADANSGGDITGVIAGSGLTGGATSGDATLGVAVPLQLTQSNADSTNEVESLTQAGIGNGLNVT